MRNAAIAAKLSGVPTKKMKRWTFSEVGFSVEGRRGDRALEPIRFSSPLKETPGRTGTRVAPSEPWVVRDWLLVQEQRCGLIQVLIRIPESAGSAQAARDALASLDTVCQVIEMATTSDVYGLALFRDALEESESRTKLAERHIGDIHWEHIRHETKLPSLDAWKVLARKQRVDSGLS